MKRRMKRKRVAKAPVLRRDKRASKSTIKALLDDVAIKHLTWKPGTMRQVGLRIAAVALAKGVFSPADVRIKDIPMESKNCVGSAFRLLAHNGIIRRTTHYHQSERRTSKGRTVFNYELRSKTLAMGFIERNRNGAKIPEPEKYERQGELEL